MRQACNFFEHNGLIIVVPVNSKSGPGLECAYCLLKDSKILTCSKPEGDVTL